MNDIRQTSKYAKYLEKIGWVVERVGEINYFIKKFPLIGSAIKIQRPEEIRTTQTIKLSKKYRAFQIIYEPKNDLDAKYLLSCGYKLSKSPYLPTKTLHLDLTQSKENLLKQMQKDARYSLRKTENLKTEKLKNLKEIENFRNNWRKAVGLKRYVPPLHNLISLKQSFKDSCLMLQCNSALKQKAGLPRQSEATAGAIFLVGDKIAYYWQAFSGRQGRKTLAQYQVVWEGIIWAKKLGAKIFDFEGIYDERFPNKKWKGFTHFKKSFGGSEVEYPGAFVKMRLPI